MIGEIDRVEVDLGGLLVGEEDRQLGDGTVGNISVLDVDRAEVERAEVAHELVDEAAVRHLQLQAVA